jgi:hypothetical protein
MLPRRFHSGTKTKTQKKKKKKQNTYQKSSLQIRNCTELSRRIEIETKSGKQLPDNNKIGRRVCRSPASLSISLFLASLFVFQMPNPNK